MTYFEACRQVQQMFEAAGVPEPAIDARYLVEFVGDFTEAGYLLERNSEMPAELFEKLMSLVKRRCEREPIQYILGSQEFMGLPFICNKDCLIPRQDTEILVERAMKAVAVLRSEKQKKDGSDIRYIDICTGSGCIPISLAKLCGIKDASGTDISEGALKVAGRNAKLNAAEVAFFESDLFEKVEGKFDIITSNPPYIDTGLIQGLIPEIWQYEPRIALDGGEDGLIFYRKIAGDAPKYLKNGGYLLFEIGDTQGEAVAGLMLENGFSGVSVHKDLAGLDRVVEGRLYV